MPPMPPPGGMPPPPPAFFFGSSATMASVVISSAATEAAFWIATRTTLVGSILPGVRLTTMHRAKGLEFNAVAIPFLSKATFPPYAALKAAVDEVDRRNILQQQQALLHVAATRAKKVLRVSWSGEPYAFVKI